MRTNTQKVLLIMKEEKKKIIKRTLFVAIAGIVGFFAGAFIQFKVDEKIYDECHEQLLDATAGLIVYKIGFNAAIKVVAEDVQLFPQYCERQSVYDAADAAKRVEKYEEEEHHFTL